MTARFVEVARIAAEGETGARYIMIVSRETWGFSDESGANRRDGATVCQLEDGRKLRRTDISEFEIVETGEMIWAVG